MAVLVLSFCFNYVIFQEACKGLLFFVWRNGAVFHFYKYGG